MDRLKGQDACFLYAETPQTPMHIGTLALFDLPESYQGRFYQVYHDFIGGRIAHVDMLRRKLANTALALDHPGWVEDEAFDLDYHLRSITLPAPGNFSQLEQTVARLHGELLDRNRPLWQMTVIEGLEDGGAALYAKVHHSELDGAGAMLLAQAMFDLSPQPRPKLVPPRTPRAEPPAPRFSGLDSFIVDTIRRDVDAVHRLPDLLRGLTNLLLPQVPPHASLRSLFDRGRWPKLPPLSAPRTRLNATITSERSFAAASLKLPDAKRIAKAAGCKLNDVVMAICAGALRRYLHDHDELPATQLTAIVPVNAREAGNGELANHVSFMLCGLATDITDPAARLKAIVACSQNSKRIANELRDGLTGDFSFIGMKPVVNALMRAYGASGLANWGTPISNLIISNVPGPPVPLFCAQARVRAMYPVSIPMHGLALNITVQSYLDQLDFGLTADRRAMPDVALLASHLPAAFAELAAAILPAEASPAAPVAVQLAVAPAAVPSAVPSAAQAAATSAITAEGAAPPPAGRGTEKGGEKQAA